MRYVTLIIIVLVYVSIFSISQKAIEYYSAAELSYKSGDYSTALRNYELALTTDPTIEGYDSYIKFKMGISAYMVGNYDKARSYLSGYNTSFVRELLSSIDKRQAQDEWKQWILKNKPVVSEVPTQTSSYQTKNNKSINFIIPIAVFLLIFATLIFAEIRILRIRRQVIELPLAPEKSSAGEMKQQVVQAGEESKKEIKVEDEVMGLIPENAKIVDFEKLINSEIDIFKDILEGTANIEEVLISEESYQNNTQEAQLIEEKQEIQEDILDDRKALIEDILQESKELIDNLEIEKSEETANSISVQLSELESKFIQKLEDYLTTVSPEKEMGVEYLEKLQQDFAYFDNLEKITDEESKLLVKKLITIHRGENN